MHVPDGFIDGPVSIVAGVIAVGGVAVCLRGAQRELDERTAPLAGLVAAFVFALQMLNFPVALGTSGHLLGGTLAAVLVGPYTGALCVTVVLIVQGLFFADGGITAIGINVVDMALVTAIVGYGTVVLLRRLLPARVASVVPAVFLGALVSVPVAAAAFTGFYALGGVTGFPLAGVFTAMVGVHVLIGLGEAVITALVVGSVLAVRPDLVYAARPYARELALHPAPHVA